MRAMTTAIAALGIIGSTLTAGAVPPAHAATTDSRHHARRAVPDYNHMPRYYNQAPLEQAPAGGSAAQRYFSDPPGWHDPSGCGIRCF